MENEEIQRIEDYIKDWEERLPRLLYDRTALQIELPEFYRVIKQLTESASAGKNQQFKMFLTNLEDRAITCRERIEELLAEWN